MISDKPWGLVHFFGVSLDSPSLVPRHLFKFAKYRQFPSGPQANTMKVITANFVTCAVKECKTSPASYPLHFHDAELEQQEQEFQPEFIRNIVPRIDWDALRTTANEVARPP